MAERVPTAKKYRNAFEVIRQKVIDQIANRASPNPREAVGGLAAQLQPTVHTFEVNQPFEVDNDSYEQFSQILADMTGESFPNQSWMMENDANLNDSTDFQLSPELDQFGLPIPSYVSHDEQSLGENQNLIPQATGELASNNNFSFSDIFWNEGTA
jgi:hypothetical protein